MACQLELPTNSDEFNGEPTARAMGVPLRGAPFVLPVSAEYLPAIFQFLPVSAGAALFLVVRTCLFLLVSASTSSALCQVDPGNI